MADTRGGRWRPAVDAIVASLADHLRQEVELVDVDEMDGAFSCFIRGPAPVPTGFQLAWNGVLGMDHFEGRAHVHASLFLYSRNDRLRLAEQSGSYLDLAYEGPLDGTGTWRDDGWAEDGYGEFEAHDHYRQDRS